MIASPENVRLIGQRLDHPESVCLNENGTLYAGGEAGQIYRITPDGEQAQIAATGGSLLGLVLDGNDNIYACDYIRRAVVRIGPDGRIVERSTGTSSRPLVFPNHPVFDRDGNLYVSDSGDYWSQLGTGCIFRIRPDGASEVFHSGPFRFANGLAIDPTHEWLYVAQSPAWNIVRVPLKRPNSPIEVAFQLPERTIPDGLMFASEGQLIVGCYRPDQVVVCHPEGQIEVLIEDPTAELLAAPTNIFLHDHQLYIANLGGYHISAFNTDLLPGPVYRPLLR